MHQIPSVIQTSRRDGMLLLEDSLAGLVKAGTVTQEEARRFLLPKLGSSAEGGDPGPAPAPARSDGRRPPDAGAAPASEATRAGGSAPAGR